MLEVPPAWDEMRRNNADVRNRPDLYTCGAGSNVRDGPVPANPILVHDYEDNYPRVDGRWLFASRRTVRLFVGEGFKPMLQLGGDNLSRERLCMALPTTNPHPPFNITRASHVVLTVRDLKASRTFYEQVLGFVVTAAGDGVLNLRGVEERGHHSITLRQSTDKPVCLRIGLRVAGDNDIARAADHFASVGLSPRRVDVPHQGATLHFADPAGVPYELCATMETVPSMRQEFHSHRSASPQRLDHFQVAVPDVALSTAFLADLGFRLTEYTAPDGKDELWGAWLQRKGNPQDIVYANGPGPRLHHFAYPVPETRDIIHVCDVASSLGYSGNVERGPGRHGIGNALFVYLRDPDGHRVEFFIGHYQAIDVEEAPIRWDLTNTRRSQLWGLPARASWFSEATEFRNVAVRPATLQAPPVTLESFLASQI